MEQGEFFDALQAECSRFYEVAARSSLDLPVPACPDWTVRTLVTHVGGLHYWVASIVAAGGDNPAVRPPQPPDGSDPVEWATAGFDAMMQAFASTGPDSPCWNFRRGSARTVAWWYRRQALESAIHRFDIESAAGSPSEIDPELAGEGVDEMLCDMLPMLQGRGATASLHGTLHLHATDAQGEWWIDFDSDAAPTREHKKADTALRGPASGLYLWLWNRQSPAEAGLEVFGPDRIVAAWRDVRI